MTPDLFHWEPQAAAGAWLQGLLRDFCRDSASIAEFAEAVLSITGTQLSDWVDQIVLPDHEMLVEQLRVLGFELSQSDTNCWSHPGALFPRIKLHGFHRRQLIIRVESLVDFLVARRSRLSGASAGSASIYGGTRRSGPDESGHYKPRCAAELGDISKQSDVSRHVIEGGVAATQRRVLISSEGDVDFFAIERRAGDEIREESLAAVQQHFEAFRLRERCFEDERIGFSLASSLVQDALADLGQARTCELFFAAERDYWQRRNRAAQVQKVRQDRLGLGWANHDHHTYRSSRCHFARLIAFFESLGLQKRERFYAGREAGWGAQVMEHPETGIVVFADVDLSPDEVLQDFARDPLPPRDALGTVGLWCRLHGEAFLEAGMHHLECQFDFDAAREQLAVEGIPTMAPFTDLPHLRQAFTVGEVWPVREYRLQALLDTQLITQPQAAQFRERGAVGSHLEILQRYHGYRGFNQKGINEIIRDTDPRTLTEKLTGES